MKLSHLLVTSKQITNNLCIDANMVHDYNCTDFLQQIAANIDFIFLHFTRYIHFCKKLKSDIGL